MRPGCSRATRRGRRGVDRHRVPRLPGAGVRCRRQIRLKILLSRIPPDESRKSSHTPSFGCPSRIVHIPWATRITSRHVRPHDDFRIVDAAFPRVSYGVDLPVWGVRAVEAVVPGVVVGRPHPIAPSVEKNAIPNSRSRKLAHGLAARCGC